MTIRRRARVGTGRAPLIYAAIHLLNFGEYRQRLGDDPHVLVAHRAAVERTLTAAELAVVDRVLDDRVRGSVVGFVAAETGAAPPDSDEETEALTQILGRTPRGGW